VARTASGEHLAKRGEVLVDEATAQALGAALTTTDWRTADESGEHFAVAGQFSVVSHQSSAPTLPLSAENGSLPPDSLRPFLLPAVYEREVSGQGSFLTEFRPCVALFVQFGGLDYEADAAQAQLDAFVRQAQAIAARYEGALMNLIIGDKGSYAYLNFGALSAHEDDARRAVKTALELREVSHLPLQMGLTQGVMRVGAYGSSTRCTYSALGDDVNVAAR